MPSRAGEAVVRWCLAVHCRPLPRIRAACNETWRGVGLLSCGPQLTARPPPVGKVSDFGLALDRYGRGYVYQAGDELPVRGLKRNTRAGHGQRPSVLTVLTLRSLVTHETLLFEVVGDTRHVRN